MGRGKSLVVSQSDKLRITEKSLERQRMLSYSLWKSHGMMVDQPDRDNRRQTRGQDKLHSALHCRKHVYAGKPRRASVKS